MTQHQINQIKVEYEVVKDQLEIARQLVTQDGFFQYWFEALALPENEKKTKTEVFDSVNQLYMEVFKTNIGKYRNYNSFITTVKRNMFDLI